MALPTCPKCDSISFTLSEIRPTGARHRYHAVVCAMCGCVVTVLPFKHTNSLVRKLAEKLNLSLEN